MINEKLEADLLLVWDTSVAYAERTGYDFWEELSPTAQRKMLENFKEDLQENT